MSVQGIDQADWLKSLTGSTGEASSLLGSSSASSTDGASSASQSEFAKIIMAQLDTDGDGKISAEEMQDAADKVKNALGQLNDISSKMRASKGQASAATIISQLDANGNSSLDITETGLTQEAFSKIDSDGNGQIAKDELTSLIDKAKGAKSSTKIKASQADCVNILSELQSKGAARQYEAAQMKAAA